LRITSKILNFSFISNDEKFVAISLRGICACLHRARCIFTNLFIFAFSSKVTRDTLYEGVNAVLEASKAKQRRFLETIELQVGLKNYDPQKDKRFSGTVKYAFSIPVCQSTSLLQVAFCTKADLHP